MKTLYVSDLDGTLLNREKKITNYTAEILNQCIEKGMYFSVATARMPYGCDYRLQYIKMNIPGILTNGVFLYDFSKKEYIMAEIIDANAAEKAVQSFKKYGLSCFIYNYEAGKISIYYDDKALEEQTQYYSDRALESCNEVELVENFDDVLEKGNVCYITYTGEKELLEPVCKELDSVEGISYSFYLNIYNGWYCLEIFASGANKRNALLRLKKLTGCEEVVVFGDNLNDLPMIEVADRSYAPENALDEVKSVVNKVIQDCNHDGVAEFLKEEMGLKIEA